MTELEQKRDAFLQKIPEKYPAPFTVERNYTCCNTVFPMMAWYESKQKRKLLGISDVPMEGVSSEKCFVCCCDTLDDVQLQEYQTLFERLHNELVDVSGKTLHMFTLISVIICAGSVTAGAEKKLKRISDHRDYNNGKDGWSALRICAYDLSREQYICNSMGKAVKECLTRDEMPKERKGFFSRLLWNQ